MTAAAKTKPNAEPSVLDELLELRKRRGATMRRRDEIAGDRRRVEHRLAEHGRDRQALQREAARNLTAPDCIEIDARIASDRAVLEELKVQMDALTFAQQECDRDIAELHVERRSDFVAQAKVASAADAEAAGSTADSLRDWIEQRRANVAAWRQAWTGTGPMIAGQRDPLQPEGSGASGRLPAAATSDRIELPESARRGFNGRSLWDVEQVAQALIAHFAASDGLPGGAVRHEQQKRPGVYAHCVTGQRREIGHVELYGDQKQHVRPNPQTIASVTPDEWGFAEWVWTEPLPDDHAEPSPATMADEPPTMTMVGA